MFKLQEFNILTTGSGQVPLYPKSRQYFFLVTAKVKEHAFGLENVIIFSCHRPVESLTS